MTRTIERLGAATSALGMGCWAIGGEWTFLGMPAGWGRTDDIESIRAVRAAFDHGIRLYDTAWNYGCGHSEELLGRALGPDRNACIISTKFGFDVDESTKTVRNRGETMRTSIVAPHVASDCEGSLRRLGTDRIDVYFLHVADYDPSLALDVMEQLEKLAEQGKIRSYGWSTDNPESVSMFAEGPHCSSVQINFSVAADQKEILGICDDKGIAAFNRGPLAMGFLTGKYDLSTVFGPTDVRTRAWAVDTFQKPVSAKLDELRDMLTVGGRTLAQGALAYIWARSDRNLPIPGIRNEKQAAENARAMEFGPLSSSEAAAVDRIMGRE
jgi:aryl-alcohol dehydrogenase-like predicted oxidoreductase